MSRRHRAVLALASLALVATSVAWTSVVPSQAAWTDRVYLQQTFASGTWVTTTTTTEPPPPPEPLGPIYPGDETTTVSVTWDPIAPVQNCADVVVGTTSDVPADWRYYIDFNATPWHGSQPDGTWWPNRIVSGPTDGVMLVGNVTQTKIQPGETLTFRHCVYNGNPPPVVDSGPETYEYTGTTLDPDTNVPWYACAEATVTGHFSAWGSPQFVGFSVPLDWAAALDQGVLDGLITPEQATALLATGLNGSFQVDGDTATVERNGDVYTLTGISAFNNTGIKAGQVMLVRGCTS